MGAVAQKVLLLLAAGAALGFSGSPTRYGRIIRSASREWKEIERRALNRAIRRLYESRLIRYVDRKDGTTEIMLNQGGRKEVLRYKVDEMAIPEPRHWDNRWRIVLFDIPETKKPLRDTLRTKLLSLGLIQFQKSVFVHPYECRNEIDFVIELYNARPYVRFIEATSIDNELHLKRKFHLV